MRSFLVAMLLFLWTGCQLGRESPRCAEPKDADLLSTSRSHAASPAPTDNPLRGMQLFVDPDSNAMQHARSLRAQEPGKAAELDRIARVPQAFWMIGEVPDSMDGARSYVRRASTHSALPIVVAYLFPDIGGCLPPPGSRSQREVYQERLLSLKAALGGAGGVVILEPYALSGATSESLPEGWKNERFVLLADAIQELRRNPTVFVYLDAGYAGWAEPEVMAELLKKAGVENAHGFALNTGRFRTTEESLDYGSELSPLVGDKHFVIDTSRNGAGPYLEAKSDEEAWCNPPHRRIGELPSTETGHPLCDAFLWLRSPGESDGECQGGPRAGVFWPELAMEYLR